MPIAKNIKPVKSIAVSKRERKRIEIQPPSFVPAVDLLLHDAKCIIASELSHYRNKSKNGAQLTPQEARIVQGYLDQLTKLQREEREQSKQADHEDLSDRELALLALRSVIGSAPVSEINKLQPIINYLEEDNENATDK